MDRPEAFRTLRLAETADRDMVRDAYWNLVRKTRARMQHDVSAAAEVEHLNEAYRTLAPGAQTSSPPLAAVHEDSSLQFVDRIAEWLKREATHVRARWRGRNPEVAIIALTALILVFIALAAGASVWLTLIAGGVLGVAVWAPWRRVE